MVFLDYAFVYDHIFSKTLIFFESYLFVKNTDSNNLKLLIFLFVKYYFWGFNVTGVCVHIICVT